MKFKVVRMCKDEALTIVPTQVVRFDLLKAESILREHGYEVSNLGVMINATKDGLTFTLYKSGRMIMNPGVDKKKAETLASDFYDMVEEAKA